MPSVLVEMLKLKNRSSGLGQFCLHLGRELVAARDRRSELSFYLPPGDAGLFGDPPHHPYSGWHRLYCPLRAGADVWHATHQDARILPSRRTALVVTVHDLNFEQKLAARTGGRAATAQLRRLGRRLARADAIVAVSHFTAAVLRDRLRLGQVPVRVVHNGLNALPPPPAAAPACAPERPFLFALGVLHARKNFHVLPGMMKLLPDLQLVIAGPRRDYEARIRDEAQRHGVRDRVVLAGEVTEAEKSWLYHHCEALVFPSLAEGFGLPLLEAMSCGKPVISSRKDSLPEIGGDLASYWDDFDPEHMATVVQAALAAHDAAAADRLRARSAQFSWARAARDYLDLYASL